MEVNKVKIKKGIPIPLESSGAPYKYPWSQLKVGDSFYMPHQQSPYSMLRAFNDKQLKKNKIKIRRKVEGEGQRIWRID